MDLSSMRSKARRQEYRRGEELLQDFNQIMQNSKIYNGEHNQVTHLAKEVYDFAASQVDARQQEIADIEAELFRQGQ